MTRAHSAPSRPRWDGEIVGHRGAAGLAPENTLAAFEAAIAAGCDRVELDVRTSVDGVAVIVHDGTLDRVVRAGAREVEMRVSRLTLRNLERIAGGAVPTLEAALRRIAGRVAVNVEIKGTGEAGREALAAAVTVLRRMRATRACVLSSFSAPLVEAARAMAPEIDRALLTRPAGGATKGSDERRIRRASALGCEGYHPHWTRVDRRLVEACHARHLRVRAWTIDDPACMEKLMDLGVDGIVTNRPDVLAEVVRRRAAR